jgi:hypothetical protein
MCLHRRTHIPLSLSLYISSSHDSHGKRVRLGESSPSPTGHGHHFMRGGGVDTATTTTTDAKKVDNWCNFGITPFEDGGVSGQYKEDFL